MDDDTQPPDDGPPHAHQAGGSPECQLCPVCVLLQAFGTSRPEVSQHLVAAAREFALALKAAVDGQVEAYDRAHAAAAERLRTARSTDTSDPL